MSSTGTEVVTCNICKSGNCSVLFADTTLCKSGRQGIVRCSDCGLVYRNTSKAKGAILEQYSSKKYPPSNPDWIEGRKRVFHSQIEMLSQFRKTGNILDIGAGHGFFVAACEQAGWNCTGIEPSMQLREFAEKDLGVDLIGNKVENAPLENESFDVVTLWNVIAHLSDPLKTLSDLHCLLRPGGAILIRSPNASFHVPARRMLAGIGRIFPRLHSVDATVFHRYSFDKYTITRMLRDAGFGNTRVSVATLSWTTTSDAVTPRFKNVVSRGVEIITRGIYFITANRLLLCPSLLAVSIKPAEGKSKSSFE